MNQPENFTVFLEISETVKEWGLLKLALCIFLCLVTLTTVLGNGVVIYVFAKSKRALRSPCHILLANLAVADFLVGAIVMPILMSVTVFDYKWYWGDLMCQLQDYVHFCLCATSMLSLVAVCLERYVGVRYPMHHKRILTTKRVRVMCGGIWLVALVLTATPLSVWPLQGSRSPFTCDMNLRHDFIFFISLSLYWLPIALIVYIYWLIYKTSNIPSAELMKWAKKSLASTVASTASMASTRRGSCKPESETFDKARAKQTRLVKKMTTLVSFMLLLYGPLFFLFLMKSIKVPWFSMDLLLAFGWIRYSSSCVNTFLYIHVVPYYKRELLRLLCNVSSSSEGNKSEVTSGLSSRERSSSISFSSGLYGGRTTKTVVNSAPNSSPELKSSTIEGGNTPEAVAISRSPAHNARVTTNSTIIREMEDILVQINR